MNTAGYLKFDTQLSTDGFRKGMNEITGSARKGGSTLKSIVGGLGIAKIASVGLNAIRNGIEGAVARYDTLNNFPKVMKALGYSAKDASKSVNKLDKGIDGLPTAMDEIVSNTQLLTASIGDLDKATDTAIALNDMFLAGGQGAEAAARGLQQYNQMLALGKVDQQSWNTIVQVAPGQLNQVAKSLLGAKANQRQLYNALKDGKVSMNDFNKEIIKLDKEGGKGFASFHDQAMSATDGIATQMKNLQTAVKKGIEKVIRAINDKLQELNLGSISENMMKLKGFINDAFKFAAEKIPIIIEWIYKLRNEIAILAGVVGTVKLVKIGYGVVESMMAIARSFQLARVQASLYNLEVGNTSKFQTLFNKDLTKTEKAFALLKQVNLGDKFASLGEKAKNAGGGVLSFLKAHKGLAVGLGVAGVAIGGAIALYKKSGGDASKMAEMVSSKVKQVIDVVKNIAGKVPEIIKEILPKIVNFFTTSLPQLLSSVGSTIGNIVSTIGTTIVNTLPKILPAIVNFLSVTLPQLIIKGAEVITNIITNLGEKIPELINTILPKITDFLSNQFPQLINSFANMLSGLAEKIGAKIPEIVDKISTVLPKVIDSFTKILPKLITTMVSVLVKMINPIINGIIVLVNGIVSMIPKILPFLINGLITIIQGLINALVTFLPMIIQGIMTVIVTLASMIGTILPPLISALIQAAIMIIQALVKALPQIIMALVQALPQIITALVNGLLKCLPQLIQGCILLVMGIVKAIPQIIMALVKAMPAIVKSLASAVVQAQGAMVKAGLQLIKAIWNGFKSWVSNLWGNITRIAKSIPQKIKSGIGKVTDIGLNIVKGIGQGITNGVSWIKNTITEFVGNVKSFIKKLFKISSPSKWAKVEVGQNIVLGVASGLKDKKKEVKAAASNLSTAIQKQLKGGKTNYTKIGKLLGQEITSGLQESLKKVRETADKFKDTLSSFSLMDNKKLTDLTAIKKQITEYGNNLKKLKNKVPESLYSQIMEMDREQGLAYTNKLLEMDKGSFDTYIKNWKEIQSKSDAIANEWYETEAQKQAKKLSNEYSKKIEKELKSLKKLMGGLGKKASKGLINGLLSQTSGLKGASKSIASVIIKTLKKQLKIKSPSRVTKEMGINIDKGLVAGIEANKKSVMDTVKDFGAEVVDKMKMAVELETGNINTMTTLKANAEYGQTIVVNSETKGDVFLDNQKVGRVITPVVSKTLKKAGVK